MADETEINPKPDEWKPRTTRAVVRAAEDPAQFYARGEKGMSRAEWEAAEAAEGSEVADAPSDKVAAFVADMAKVPGKTPPEPDRVEVVVVDVSDHPHAHAVDPQAWGTAVAVAKSDPQVKAAAQAAHPPAAPSRARKEPGTEPACERYESPRKGGVFDEPATTAEGYDRYRAVNDRLKWLRAVRTAQKREWKKALDKGPMQMAERTRMTDALAATESEIKEARARLVLLDRRIKALLAAA